MLRVLKQSTLHCTNRAKTSRKELLERSLTERARRDFLNKQWLKGIKMGDIHVLTADTEMTTLAPTLGSLNLDNIQGDIL